MTGCSLGYDSEGPYPYSHVNSPNSTYQSSASSRNTPVPIPTPRTKPAVPGRQVVASGTSTVRVGRGDTVYAISRKYGVSVRSIINSNNLRPPYMLNSGQTLKIPAGSTYTVKRGDTVYGVSRANGVQMSELVKLNNLKSPYALNVGQKLNLPGRSASSARPTQVAIAPPPQITGKGFMWPIKGRVLSNFGPKQAGYHNDGINIAAPEGSNVYASESGVVVHADNKLAGYGNLVLIKHQNGWVTAYAHNDSLMVKKGDQVKRGDVIAKVGQTGRVTRPQLHFEMRKGSRAVNPVQYLKS
ncbi:M23 family metallopeptidase [Pseudemcibacter aquimaris]|uniref:M23 family metallopeptidase n=1 Tax=Pseudemcibacter aquimaris TaxID=2857064 RepID=UPI0020135DB5|nr:M23 family metallopeptidase [Pseudemcibacter aquimaris]MCC3860540.1 M23 family metallopeptidase [Pseudemcibacter aquimaris]WDU59364.1 M23 family metallopeptidase [Pseudemcibacter aquimaris]